MEPKLNPVIGYDNKGLLFEAENFILRKILPAYWNDTLDIYNTFTTNKFIEMGFVETEVYEEFCLKHKKYIVSYPYEWPANMFKDAVLFHLNLFIELDNYGLTIKDGLPGNIVFNFCKPVFVDFLSLIRKENLNKELWLVEGNDSKDCRLAVFDKMFTPFIIIPLLSMLKKDYELSRSLLFEKACNTTNSAPKWNDLYPYLRITYPLTRLLNLVNVHKCFSSNDYQLAMRIYKLLKSKSKMDFIIFGNQLIELIANVDVTPTKSSYVNYYDDKKENYNFDNQSNWQNKQKNILAILNQFKPKRVLDIGSNTGWFSLLAESLGSEVISIEIDEASIDFLYLHSKENKLKILPLKMSFEDLTKLKYGIVNPADENTYKDRDFKSNPVFLPATERLKSDLVLCLALSHHLILGADLEINDIFETLSKITTNVLVFEFTDLQDELIKNEPSFFKNLHKYTLDTYNLDKITSTGCKFFKNFEIMDSHPDTRKLIVFNK